MPSSQPPTTQQQSLKDRETFHLATFQIVVDAPTHWPDSRAEAVIEKLEEIWDRHVESFINAAHLVDEELKL